MGFVTGIIVAIVLFALLGWSGANPWIRWGILTLFGALALFLMISVVLRIIATFQKKPRKKMQAENKRFLCGFIGGFACVFVLIISFALSFTVPWIWWVDLAIAILAAAIFATIHIAPFIKRKAQLRKKMKSPEVQDAIRRLKALKALYNGAAYFHGDRGGGAYLSLYPQTDPNLFNRSNTNRSVYIHVWIERASHLNYDIQAYRQSHKNRSEQLAVVERACSQWFFKIYENFTGKQYDTQDFIEYYCRLLGRSPSINFMEQFIENIVIDGDTIQTVISFQLPDVLTNDNSGNYTAIAEAFLKAAEVK